MSDVSDPKFWERKLFYIQKNFLLDANKRGFEYENLSFAEKEPFRVAAVVVSQLCKKLKSDRDKKKSLLRAIEDTVFNIALTDEERVMEIQDMFYHDEEIKNDAG